MAIKFLKDQQAVLSFVRCVGYYQWFIKDFAKIATSTTDMMKRGAEIYPTPERLASFETMKKLLITAPILATPDWNKVFHIYVDVSGFCIGSVLSQLNEVGRDHPIYYASQ